ncbi:unnamed protein product [Adineta ricciae]|uniref:Uncharacterized protein n=1 Tax=Adineta ricciae TaxID=249248 RepID=A0A815L9L5_ADIRI|nr:unnamed protein product [Adineta ricciae]CAF1666506.1 unnamed protein product [Adineta ricciae]
MLKNSNRTHVYGVELESSSSNNSSGRHRREHSKRQALQDNQKVSGGTFRLFILHLSIVYPTSCGISQVCKKKFLTNVQNLMNAHTN